MGIKQNYNNYFRLFFQFTVLAASALVIFTAGCLGGSETDHSSAGPPQGTTEIKIGVLLPISGEEIFDFKTPVQMAVSDINSAGGIGGTPVKALFFDTDGKEITEIAEEAAGDPDINIFIGPSSSEEALKAAPVFIENKKLLISPSASSMEVSAQFTDSGYFRRTVTGDHAQAAVIFEILKEKGAESACLIYEDSAYGRTFDGYAPEYAESVRIELIKSITLTNDKTQDSDLVYSIAALNPDYIIAAVMPEEAVMIKENLNDAGSDAELFLTDGGRSPYIIEKLGINAEGICGISPSYDPTTGYYIPYSIRNKELPGVFSAQTYDAVMLAAYTAAWNMTHPEETYAEAFESVTATSGIYKGWDSQEAGESISYILSGGKPDVSGASGTLDFRDGMIGPDSGYYACWVIEEGDFRERKYYSSDKQYQPRLPGLSYTGIPAETSEEKGTVWIFYPSVKGDRSFADAAYTGLSSAYEENSFIKREFSLNDAPKVNEIFASGSFTEKPDLVITIGYEFDEYTADWAEKNPDIRFIGVEQSGSNLSNHAVCTFMPYGGSYLAGVLAAEMTETENIGIIAGTDAGVIKPFTEGFKAGAYAYDPDVYTSVNYVSSGFEGFSMPDKAEEVADRMYNSGVDVIIMLAGSSNTGIVNSAINHGGVYLIGEDVDQSYLAPGVIAASVVKNIEGSVKTGINETLAGDFKSGNILYSMENSGTGLLTSDKFTDKYSELMEKWRNAAETEERRYTERI
ncbi:BMP family ABC transporter substrate-binding protein [Methanoplanus endosymbiosus]|uniref:BMP family ABC transporter substrate-binding protein n=1 Tax=Methanoplanus endosymbiosus TaxID=33865 RepID=A0A9E7PM18_9EURY|nr:BMP family ABC transporter substrate-binding protein [Methanoplanus endosymbiosus]UUX91434.1 BMP family ABC transporter substrate-binding protein [Methanoplanus endosymbiosus]